MLITNAEYNLDSAGIAVAVTAIFDGVQRRVEFDPNDQSYCQEFVQQVDDGTIIPTDVYD